MTTKAVSETEQRPQTSTPPPTTMSLPTLISDIERFNTDLSAAQGEQVLVALDDHAMALLAEVESIAGLTIRDDAERLQVDGLSAAVRMKRDEYQGQYRKYKDPVVRLGQFFDAAWRKVKGALDRGLETCDGKILRYDIQKREEAERERRRLQQIADAEAAKALQRQIAEAERAAAKAVGLQKKAWKEEIRDLKSTEAVAPIVTVPLKAPEEAGQKTRRYWHVEVVDLRQLLVAVVAGEAAIESVEPSLTFLNQQARSMARDDGSNGMNAPKLNGRLPFPGVRAVPDDRRGR